MSITRNFRIFLYSGALAIALTMQICSLASTCRADDTVQLVEDLNPSGNFYPGFITSVTGGVVFASDQYDFPDFNSPIYFSDGTAAGTRQVLGAASFYSVSSSNGVAYFAPWPTPQIDGTYGISVERASGSASELGAISPLPSSTFVLGQVVAFKNRELTVLSDPTNGQQIWSADSSGGDLQRLSTFMPNVGGISDLFLLAKNDKVAYLAMPPYNATGDDYYGVLKTDGTLAGSSVAPLIAASYFGYYGLLGAILPNNALIYVSPSNNTKGGRELLTITDGTNAGTFVLSTSTPEAIGQLMNWGNKVAALTTDFNTYQIWITDGTAAGTNELTLTGDDAGLVDSTKIALLTTLPNGGLLFSTNNALFRGLQNSATTLLVTKVADVTVDPYAQNTLLADTLYFPGSDVSNVSGEELWRTDGTPSGTYRVADLNPGTASSFPHDIVASAGKIFFGANDNTHGDELWIVQPDDLCPNDPNKLNPGTCGCGIVESNQGDGVIHCTSIPQPTPTATPTPAPLTLGQKLAKKLTTAEQLISLARRALLPTTGKNKKTITANKKANTQTLRARTNLATTATSFLNSIKKARARDLVGYKKMTLANAKTLKSDIAHASAIRGSTATAAWKKVKSLLVSMSTPH